MTEIKVVHSREKIYNIYNKVLVSGMHKSTWRKMSRKMAKRYEVVIHVRKNINIQ